MKEDFGKRRELIRYKEAMEIVKKENIRQKLLLEALDCFFYEDQRIPQSEKKSISEIGFDDRNRAIILRVQGGGNSIYENRTMIARKTGWYFYVTGSYLQPSELSIRVDHIPRRFDKSDLQWDLTDGVPMKLRSLASGPNRNAFLLEIGAKNILLDAGFSSNDDVRHLKKTTELDAIFVSHAHYDHTRALLALVQCFPDVPVILSRTTLDFFLFRNGCLERNFKEKESALVENALFVKNGDIVPLSKGTRYFEFFFGGHMPGSLMLYAEIDGFRFLYTGDYSYYDYGPIPGIYKIVDQIPSPIDFLLVDGTSSDKRFHRPKLQFDFLRTELTSRAKVNDRVLIVADSGSLAIIIFMSIHNHFVDLKEKEHFERPFIFLNRKVREFARILYTRKQDLHRYVAEGAERGSNPFQSAMIKWISDNKELIDAERLLKSSESRGSIVILDPSDLDKDEMLNFLKVIAADRHNAIYFAGALRDYIPVELSSGKDDLAFPDGTVFHNEAQILNRIEPGNILNLHGDRLQLKKVIDELRPREICLFHQNQQKLSPVRRWINKECPFVRETHSVYDPKIEISMKRH